jgi:hypothetical protein
VQAVTVDLKKNWLRVRYDPEQVTPEMMREVVRKQEFEGIIVGEG